MWCLQQLKSCYPHENDIVLVITVRICSAMSGASFAKTWKLEVTWLGWKLLKAPSLTSPRTAFGSGRKSDFSQGNSGRQGPAFPQMHGSCLAFLTQPHCRWILLGRASHSPPNAVGGKVDPPATGGQPRSHSRTPSAVAVFAEYNLQRCQLYGGGARGSKPLTQPILKLTHLWICVYWAIFPYPLSQFDWVFCYLQWKHSYRNRH